MRQFENDETDYKSLKQDRAEDRQSIKEIKDSFSLNVGSNPDRLIAILNGTYRPPSLPGESDSITRPISAASFARGIQRKATMSDLEEREGGSIRRAGDNTVSYRSDSKSNERFIPTQSKYAELVDTLDRFKFSSDETRRKQQMKIVSSVLRNALQDLVLEEVAVNTKSKFKGYAEKVVKAPGGLKVYFNFGGKKFAVVAKGGFHGDETICVRNDAGKIQASVLRIEGEDYSDLSDSFEIVIGKVQ